AGVAVRVHRVLHVLVDVDVAAGGELVEQLEAQEAPFPLRALQRAEARDEGEGRAARLHGGDGGDGYGGRPADDVEEHLLDVDLEAAELVGHDVHAVALG